MKMIMIAKKIVTMIAIMIKKLVMTMIVSMKVQVILKKKKKYYRLMMMMTKRIKTKINGKKLLNWS